MAKPELLPDNYPGVYQLDCSYNGRYTDESKKKVLTCCIEHHRDSMKGQSALLNAPMSSMENLPGFTQE